MSLIQMCEYVVSLHFSISIDLLIEFSIIRLPTCELIVCFGCLGEELIAKAKKEAKRSDAVALKT